MLEKSVGHQRKLRGIYLEEDKVKLYQSRSSLFNNTHLLWVALCLPHNRYDGTNPQYLRM